MKTLEIEMIEGSCSKISYNHTSSEDMKAVSEGKPPGAHFKLILHNMCPEESKHSVAPHEYIHSMVMDAKKCLFLQRESEKCSGLNR